MFTHFTMFLGGLPRWVLWATPVLSLFCAYLALVVSRVRKDRRGICMKEPAAERLRHLRPALARPRRSSLEALAKRQYQMPTPVRSGAGAGPVQTMTGASASLAGNDQRLHLRRNGNPVPVKITNEDASAPPYDGEVTDRSRGGICLAVRSSD